MSEDLQELRERLRAASELAGDKGEAWLERLEPEFSTLPRGTVVIINCMTGEYVTGTTRLAALREFQERFGQAAGLMHEVGGGIFVGGGIV
jgi:hypothetical protein